MERKARKYIIPNFVLEELTDENDPASQKIPIGNDEHCYVRHKLIPSYDINQKLEHIPLSFRTFPIVLKRDGAPWDEANSWLINKIEEDPNYNVYSLGAHAEGLAAYCEFLEAHNINWLEFPDQKHLRPTYRYRTNLRVFSSVMLIVQINSRMERNLNKVGQRLSWTTLRAEPLSSDDLKKSLFRKIFKYILIVGFTFVCTFLSWLYVALVVGSFLYKTSKDYGALQAVKEFRWKLRNVDLTFDQMIQEMMKLDNAGHATFEQYKEALQRELILKGLMHHSEFKDWEGKAA